jgi:hypothetical protein
MHQMACTSGYLASTNITESVSYALKLTVADPPCHAEASAWEEGMKIPP